MIETAIPVPPDGGTEANHTSGKGINSIKFMTNFANIDVTVPAIVCLDPSGSVWNKLRNLLEDDSHASEFILTRTSKSSTDLLALCRRLVPVLLVVTEDQMPDVPVAGLHGQTRPSGIQILLISEKTDHPSLEAFFRLGCAGVVSIRAADQTFLTAIRALFAGDLWLPRKLLSHIAREVYLRGPLPKLTRRESDILQLISLGNTNQQIADQCFISRETVRWHIRSLYDKIGVDNREGAMREAKSFLQERTN